MSNKEPIEIVELYQPRCVNRFGVSPCTAVLADGPRCYNCWGTCLDKSNYNGTGSITWRFTKVQQYLEPLFEINGEHIKTNAFPMLTDVSTRSAKINVGSIRDGEKPLGVTGSASISLKDAPFTDYVGDYYRALRSSTSGNFWAKWTARNPFFANMQVTHYSGYAGDALVDMRKSLYILDNVTGPDGKGLVTLTAVDPLRLTDNTRAQFPRETRIRLYADIDATTTTVSVVVESVTDLSDQFGNTTESYILVGSEIISYTGYSGGTDNIYALSGVTRATLGTTAATHSLDDGMQRVGRYEQMDAYQIGYDLITNHTAVPASFIDYTAWQTEAVTYLTGYTFSRTVHKPTAVNALLGELMRDGTFYIWWDELTQLIPLKAMRPEYSQSYVTDDNAVIAGTVSLRREPDERISRVFVYYNQIDPTKGDDPTNFRNMRGQVSADVELEDAGAEIRSKTIYSKWIRTDAQATEFTQRLLTRFGYSPRYITLQMVDNSFKIGEIVNLNTRVDVDTEGNARSLRWQIIAAQEIRSGESIEYQLQEFLYQATRYAYWMGDAAPAYADATETEREFNSAWWSNDLGEMVDGTEGYLWQ